MNDSTTAIFLIAAILILSTAFYALGRIEGEEIGKKRACISIGLELHQDKCMKVVREAV
jgi:hypothetical protein